MKKHNLVKVVLITMLLFLLLTWILPAAYYSGEYVEQGRVQMGLFDLFNYPMTALSYFGYIAFYLVLIGGFYGVLYKIPAYRSFLDKIVTKVQGKEKVVLSIIAIVLALAVSICGLQVGLALFIPFLVALILLMGYDKVVAALVIVGSMIIGLVGSTYAYQNASVLMQTLSLNFDYEIGARFAILLVGVVLVIFNTLMYIKHSMSDVKIEKKKAKAVLEEANSSKPKTTTATKSTTKKKSTSKSKATKTRKNDNKAALKDEDIIIVKDKTLENEDFIPTEVNSDNKIWPFVVGFLLLLVLFVLAFLPWGENGFGISLFDDVTKAVTEFELFGFPIFGKILGTVNSFGSWTIPDMFLPIILLLIILMFIYKVKIKDAFEGFAEGAKRAMGPAFIVILIYSILVLVTYHPFQLVIYKAILGLSKGFNIATTSIVAIIASIVNGDGSYAFQSVLPYYISVVTNGDNYSLVGVIFQAMYGLTMLVAPTSIILMGVLSYLEVSYGEWLKRVWKLLLELFVVLLILFIILALI